MNIEEARAMIENWAAWCADDEPNVWFPKRCNFARLYVPTKEEWGEDAPVEMPQQPIDELEAHRVDKIIGAATFPHMARMVIAFCFLNHGFLHAQAKNTIRMREEDLRLAEEAALRAFIDACERLLTPA